jgi:hypothetical protein
MRLEARRRASRAPPPSYLRDADISFAGAQTRVILLSRARRVEAALAVGGRAAGPAVKDVSGKPLKLQKPPSSKGLTKLDIA